MTYNIWEAGHAEVFAQNNPSICLSYEIMPPELLLQRLTEGHLDLIISGERGDPDTTFSILLRQLPIFVLLSQEDPLSQKSEIHLEDLSHHSILMNASTLFSCNIHHCFQAEGIEADFYPFPSHDPLTLLRTIRSIQGAYFDTKLHFLYQNLLDGLVAIPFRHEGSHPFPSWNVLATTTLAKKDSLVLQQYIHHLKENLWAASM